MSIILISPYGSNDLLIRFTHSAVRQFEDNLLFLPKRMLRAALVGKTKSITIGVNRYRNYDYFLSKQFFDDPNDNHNYDQRNYDI